jgi:hypothetical protein
MGQVSNHDGYNKTANSFELSMESWKVFQIMAEFVEGFEQLSCIRPAVSIFGSARSARDSANYQKAEEIAHLLSESGFAVISGGGPGIMEAANKGGYRGRSPSIGLNIQLPMEQSANEYQDVSLDFKHFFSRKVMFVKYASAYVVMPGGFGTLDELAEILTLVQTGKSRKIPIILVDGAFWGGLLKWMREAMCSEGTISPDDLDLIQVCEEPQAVVDAIFAHYEARGFEPSAAERKKMLEL